MWCAKPNSVSAIRFYEEKRLIAPLRNASGQRRFRRSDIRRLSFVLIAQRLGFSIKEIHAELVSLPADRAPTQRDWARISRAFRRVLDQRIEGLTRMRDRLDDCIGCGSALIRSRSHQLCHGHARTEPRHRSIQ